MSRPTFTQGYDGKWMRPKMRGYRVACCDCGLIHRKSFRVVADEHGRLCVEYVARRDGRLTKRQLAAVRKNGSAKI